MTSESSPQALVREFNVIMGIAMPADPDASRLHDPHLARKMQSMLRSEVAELQRHVEAGELEDVGLELAGLVYIAYGFALELGIDLDEFISAVHRANLTRRSAEGQVIRDSDGKVLKGPDYKPPLVSPSPDGSR